MNFRKKRIIITDDSQASIMYMGMLLKRMGFNVIPAESGLETLKLMKIVEPDLIILDIHMPHLDGLKTLRHIKEDTQTSNIPVIMLSGESGREIVEKCKNLGCSGYLTKPLNIDKLHDVLQENIFAPTGFRRKHLRAPFLEKINVVLKDKSYEIYSESLSEGGIYLRRKDPFPVGTEVKISLPFNDKSLLLKGNVIYTKGLFGDMLRVPPGMAVEFRGLSSDNLMMLKRYVTELLAHDLVESQEENVISIDDSKAEKIV